jgi:hypothetical protein
VWGNVTAVTFATEEGAFLRGQIQMEEELDLGLVKVEPPAEDESIEDGEKEEDQPGD